jgi:hypothetical protein
MMHAGCWLKSAVGVKSSLNLWGFKVYILAPDKPDTAFSVVPTLSNAVLKICQFIGIYF